MRSFAKVKPSRNSENSLSLSHEGKSYRSRDFVHGNINTSRENKILAKLPNLQYSYLAECLPEVCR